MARTPLMQTGQVPDAPGLTRLMNGNDAGTQAYMTTVQEFEVENYNLIQEIFLKYSNRSRKFC